MPRLAANLSMMFNEIDFLDRFAAAARHGFTGCEFLFPYAYPKEEIARRLKESGLAIALHNMPPGNWDAGERGIACLPDRIEEFQASVEKALAYATALGLTRLHCMAGIMAKGVPESLLRETYKRNVDAAADAARKVGVKLLLEPINARDMPGYFLSRPRQAITLMDEIGNDNVFLQFDIYHAQIMEGDLAPSIEKLLPRIAHMQLADTPGRNEPGTGEINYRFLFEFVDRIGYDGWIGCEYRPKAGTAEGLGWVAAHGVPGIA